MITMRRVESFEGFASVRRLIEAGVGNVHAADVLGICPDMREIPGALRKAVVVGDERPVHAAVVAAIETAFLGFNESVDDTRIRAGNRDADAAECALGHAVAFDALPGRAVIVRTIEAVLRAAAIESPGGAPAFPHRGK